MRSLWIRPLLGVAVLGFSLSLGWLLLHGGKLPVPLATVLGAEPAAMPGEPESAVRVVGFGHVDVEDGVAPLTVAALGAIEEILVKEGEVVKAAAPLIRLRSELAQADLARAQAAETEANIKLAQARRAAEQHRLLLEQQGQAVAAATARLESQRRQVERLERLNETLVVADENYLSARDRLRELEFAIKADQLRLEQLGLEKPAEAVELATAMLAAARAQVRRARENLAQHTLTAPSDGVVLRIIVARGQILGSGQTQPAIWFCPDQPRIVRCEIEQEFADRIASGLPADLFPDGELDRKWRGKVMRCGDWIAHRRSLLDEPFQRNDVRTLECIVSIDPKQAPLRIGQRMRVVVRERMKAE